MRNRSGRLVSLKERSEAIADYLEKEHWFNPPENEITRVIPAERIIPGVPEETQAAPFSLKELEIVISLTKKEKSQVQT
jgi:hypothetical protein